MSSKSCQEKNNVLPLWIWKILKAFLPLQLFSTVVTVLDYFFWIIILLVFISEFTMTSSPQHSSNQHKSLASFLFEELAKPIDILIEEFLVQVFFLVNVEVKNMEVNEKSSEKSNGHLRCNFKESIAKKSITEELQAICQREKEKIESIYPNKNTQHRYFTKYRNAIKKAGIKTGEVTSTSSPLLPPSYLNLILNILKLNKADSDGRSLQRDLKIHERSNNMTLINVELFIQQCRSLLRAHKNDPYTLAVAIMGLTGRRPIEVLKTACLRPLNGHYMFFSGQAKTKNSPTAQKSYPIPVLAPPREIASALDLLRKLLPLASRENEQISQSFYHRLLSRVQIFQNCIDDNSGVSLNCRSLRGIYVASAYELFNISNKASFNAFASRVLGHSKLDLNTANSYTYFAVVKNIKNKNLKNNIKNFYRT